MLAAGSSFTPRVDAARAHICHVGVGYPDNRDQREQGASDKLIDHTISLAGALAEVKKLVEAF